MPPRSYVSSSSVTHRHLKSGRLSEINLLHIFLDPVRVRGAAIVKSFFFTGLRMVDMFSRLSRQSARWLDVRIEHALFGYDDAIVSLFHSSVII